MSGFSERALVFSCGDESLVGVLALPSAPAKTGFVIVVGGPQTRIGSHRQFVHLARHLATQGFACLRFDVRGMGDATGAPRSFESIGEDIAAAIDALVAHTSGGIRVVLWGLCDGASAALLYLQQPDARVSGLCLLNPWVRSEVSHARTQVRHYYAERLRQREFWTKLLSGRVAASALGSLLRSAAVAMRSPAQARRAGGSFQDRMAAAWGSFDGATLLILSQDDYTAREFLEYTKERPAWQALLARPDVVRHDLEDADHTFSAAQAKRRVAERTACWARQALPA